MAPKDREDLVAAYRVNLISDRPTQKIEAGYSGRPSPHRLTAFPTPASMGDNRTLSAQNFTLKGLECDLVQQVRGHSVGLRLGDALL